MSKNRVDISPSCCLLLPIPLIMRMVMMMGGDEVRIMKDDDGGWRMKG